MPATVPATTDQLLDLLRRSELLPATAFERAVAAAGTLPADPVHAANLLVRRGVLTHFQARMLLAGKARGFRIGGYTIREQIGQGGMGAVYLAEDAATHRRVAVKVLHPTAASDPDALDRFRHEGHAAAALDHPNVVRLFEAGTHDGLWFLAMEFVEGQTLEHVIRTGGISARRAVGYVMQVAAGLQHAFEKGYVHCDIKPANLIRTTDGTVKILDMGLARTTAEASDGPAVGTADYVAPEQAVNRGDIDIRADIYSLGVTFFALVTGRPPFDGPTARKLMQHQLKDAPSLSTIDRTFPPELAAVVAKMMAKKPDDRYPTPAAVIAALKPWLEGGKPRRGVPRWVWFAAGGVLLAALAVVGMVLLTRG